MKNILVIEDSRTINNIIKKELTLLGFEVSQAHTLAEAKEFLTTLKFQLIILDLHLPDGEGSELIAHIQSLTKTKVIILTSSQDADLREELFQYGILDYIIKDTNFLYSISEIVKIIHTINTKKKDKILVIDDSKFICKQIKTVLEPRNYDVHIAMKAKTAFEKLKKEEYNLIILDMELPDIHGLEFLKLLRKDSRFLSIPIIVLSGTSTPDIIRDVLKNGANDFLKKPYVFEEFILKVDLWIDYFKKEKELAEANFQLKYTNDNLERLVYEEVEKNRKKDEIMFTQSRHAQMGEMIAMIAHQWRQPLNAMATAAIVLELKAQNDKLDAEEAKKISEKLQNYINYLSHTIDDFRNFFKPQKEKRVTDFEKILHTVTALVQHSLEQKNIHFEKEITAPQQFLAFENELVQVVLNIIKNAQDALVQNNIKNPKITLKIDKNSLHIVDNAGGIPSHIQDKIFQPYFSTKTEKNGTGLGLYMSRMIIEKHSGGNLSVQNTKEGAEFIIEMPVYKGEKNDTQ
ncbi:response regulator [Sulfurimonas sp. SWIR-19]|uniref:ATP-binding response regulator n=1 Tax=Sulfurimonas sp. SWIR-19 TaxID=2878390 RepID=UPI001CF18548|nr:hybrid sensor histidine kinase/response regulator [Sulfurimonas sp. SWIR-19]UCN00247.1 response regulator [Sulfurimonas sp. SWIR-19]